MKDKLTFLGFTLFYKSQNYIAIILVWAKNINLFKHLEHTIIFTNLFLLF